MSNVSVTTSEKLDLPAITEHSSEILEALTNALNIPRDVLASNDQIQHAWEQLPRLLSRIPVELRDERLLRMCVAVSCGLFDAGINYAWNASIVELREKIRRFGIDVIPQILDRDFDEDDLIDSKDAELLSICRKLNLISEEAFFFLDQCRDIRNSYSVAHPADSLIDEDEFVTFVARCQKHALSSTSNPEGVDTRKLLKALNSSRFNDGQTEEWINRFEGTYDAQRDLIFIMLHGIYSDPESSETERRNVLKVCLPFRDRFSPKAKSGLIDKHQDYVAKGDEARQKASNQFFEELKLIDILGNPALHRVFTLASKKLLRVHNSFDNFYNEPPFAERLHSLSRDYSVPSDAQIVFVEAVVTCAVGNRYGVSNAALPFYEQMIKEFSPAEITFMLQLPGSKTTVGNRIKTEADCQARYKELVNTIPEDSIPTNMVSRYKRITK